MRHCTPSSKAVAEPWRQAIDAHAASLEPSADQIIDAIWQEAYDRAAQRRFFAEWRPAAAAKTPPARPSVQAAFCIDVRSEIIRRALESLDPGVETLGFAGFFGIGVSHRRFGSIGSEARLPVLLKPGLGSFTCDAPGEAAEEKARIGAGPNAPGAASSAPRFPPSPSLRPAARSISGSSSMTPSPPITARGRPAVTAARRDYDRGAADGDGRDGPAAPCP